MSPVRRVDPLLNSRMITKLESQNSAAPPALWLLARVNLLQAWRRLKSVRQQSVLLTTVISLFVLGYLAVSFWLFYKGLTFLKAFPGLGTVLTERLLYLLFALLFGLLLLSNVVISYGNFFRNRESTFLLSMPVRWETVFRWKFIESALLASWAFLFLIAPLLVAFGLTRGVSWHFYVVTPALIALFIVLPGVAGGWFSIVLARYLDRRSFQVLALLAGAMVLALAAFWWQAQPATDDLLETRVLDMLDQLLVKTRFAQFAFLPSYWLSTSVIQWAEGVVSLAGFFMLVLLSNCCFFGLLAFTRLGQAYYDSASAVQSRASAWGSWAWWRRRQRRDPAAPRLSLVERVIGRLRWFTPGVRALVLKDARTFWRDTTQWGQSVMLFGLLGAYIINLRHFTHHLTSPFWVHLVSYLNLGACSLNLATLTTRFVFPQFSLEGRRLWIIGMSPLGLERVVKTKYWLASGASLVVTLSLITLSSCLLNLAWDRVAFFSAVVSVMTFTLNGLAVGLGVLFPNFKDPSPSKIVSGFGGTLCLVLSFLYILAALLLLGLGTTGLHPHTGVVVACVGGFALLSFLVGWLPLKLALRSLRALEI